MHYVYELRDPRTGAAFYVGKGRGDRAYQHQREVVNGSATSNPAKIRKIKEILAAGLQTQVLIVAEYKYEEDALEHEFQAIESNPTLTNMMPGGLGSTSLTSTAERHCKRVKNLLALLEKLQREARIKYENCLLCYPEKARGELREFSEGIAEAVIAGMEHRQNMPAYVAFSVRLKNLGSRVKAARELLVLSEQRSVLARKAQQIQRAGGAAQSLPKLEEPDYLVGFYPLKTTRRQRFKSKLAVARADIKNDPRQANIPATLTYNGGDGLEPPPAAERKLAQQKRASV